MSQPPTPDHTYAVEKCEPGPSTGAIGPSGVTLFSLPRTEVEAISFLQDRGVLLREPKCRQEHPVKLLVESSRVIWFCRACDSRVGIRTGSWLENTRLPLVTIIRFIYAWSTELSSIKWCEEELGMDHSTVVAWNEALREVCFRFLQQRPRVRIGGPGRIVEIYETLYTKRKNNVDRILPQQWVFGGPCRETKACFMVAVPNRTASTLLRAIMDNIEVGSTIYSDCWAGHKTKELERAGYAHKTVNHKYNFVAPTSKAHTQNVERLWGSAKWRNKRHRGTSRSQLNSYLVEFAWRQQVDGKPFDAILAANF